MVTLVIEGAGGSQLTYQLDKQSISVGASSHNDVVLRTPGVAPQHVVIQRNGDVFTFLGQHRQVVVLNGERRSRGVLKVGDRIRIGSATIIFKGGDDGGDDIELVDRDDRPTERPPAAKGERSAKPRSELVLYRESHRLTEARQQLVELFRSRVRSDLVPSLRAFLAAVFPERRSLIALVDERGAFVPVVSQWEGDLPRLPSRAFAELGSAGRYAVAHVADRLLLVYPVDRGLDRPDAYVLVESNDEHRDDDRELIGELARVMSVHWERIESSTARYGEWASRAQKALSEALPGTSQAVHVLRDSVGAAARTSAPVLLCGPSGVGRMYLAGLIASLRPEGEPPVKVVQAQKGDNADVGIELFGPPGDDDGSGLAERSRGSVIVVRDVHLLPSGLQRELAATVTGDLKSPYGPAIRWMATAGEDPSAMLNEGVLDVALFRLFEGHLIRVPSLGHRREDLPLLIVRLIERIGAEQGKEIRGIELETLNSLLDYEFNGEMTELIEELRRLVSATADGEMVRGVVPRSVLPAADSADGDRSGQVVSSLLGSDDLKTVIPGVERLIIDRVLRRTKGNQSQAARVLNLSRGALISKIKDYEIPDYRALKRRSGGG
jgi:DNA-binding NtrC family response regulator